MNPFRLFGFEIKRPQNVQIKTPVIAKTEPDTAVVSSAAAFLGHYIDIDGVTFRNDKELIQRYRAVAQQPEVDNAIQEITNEAISTSEKAAPVAITINDPHIANNVKDKICVEFNKVLSLLDFNASCSDIFRKWYIDGRLYYHILIDKESPSSGIQEIRPVSPLNIRKVKEVDVERDDVSGVDYEKLVAEYYVYTEEQVSQNSMTVTRGASVHGLKISKDSVVFVPSGLVNEDDNRYISHLHKAIKPANQLRMLEDALVIYRYSRAPERRIFYIDTGKMPRGKAEEYVRSVMANYRNKMVYDASSGEIRDDRKHMSMLEDFWLPRGEGGKGTEITTLPGGDGMDQTDHLTFFKKRLLSTLNVPLSRLDNTSTFMFGKTSEISREEVKFQRFIDALRKKFSQLFLDILKTQLILRRIISEKDWNYIKEKISIDFLKDNYFTELKEIELLKERLAALSEVKEYIGKYFSEEYVRKKILRQSDDEIKKISEEIANEKGTVNKKTREKLDAVPENIRKSEQEIEETPIDDESSETPSKDSSMEEIPTDEPAVDEVPKDKKETEIEEVPVDETETPEEKI